MGKLPLPPIFNLECSDSVVGTAAFVGDDGSTFIAKCPRGCKQAPGIVQGTSIFRDDGSVCLSAVHSGVIQNEDGGYILISKKPGLKNYIGQSQRGIVSFNAGESESGSYSISRVPSNLFAQARLYEKSKDDAFVNLGKAAQEDLDEGSPGAEDPNPEAAAKEQKQKEEAKKRNEAAVFLETSSQISTKLVNLPPVLYYTSTNNEFVIA